MAQSSRYDWFKKGAGAPVSKTPRERARKGFKLSWRILRILLLFMLFFTSLWGCGQSFAITANGNIGRSLEFARSEDTLPPHVSAFNVRASKTGVAPEAASIYSVVPVSSNIWIQSYGDGKEMNRDVAAQVRRQNGTGDLAMSAAENGANETIMIINADGSFVGGRPIVYLDTEQKVPLAGSSAATNPIYTRNKTVDGWYTSYIDENLNNLIINKQLNLLATKIPEATTTPGTTPTTTPTPPASEATHLPVSWNGTLAATFPATIDTNTALDQGAWAIARSSFRDELFRQLNAAGTSNWIFDALSLKGAYAFPAGQIIDETNKSRYDAIAQAQNDALSILAYLGYGSQRNATAGLISPNLPYYMPGEGGRYTPIVTWEQAWTRGFGPFYGLIAYPIGQFQLAVLDAFPLLNGWESLIAMVIVIFTLRAFGFLVSIRSTLQQTKMQEIQLKRATIEAKYAAYKGNKQMMARKQQEMQALFKREGVRPLSFLTSLLVTMPIFLSMWRVISHTPQFKVVNWIGINFSATSWRELLAGKVIYLPLMAVALGASLLQNFYPRLLTRRRNKQRSDAHLRAAIRKSERTQIIVTLVFAVIAVIFTAGVQIYSIVVAIWSILQAQLTHTYLVQRSKRIKEKALVR